jgi:thioredoxin-like negative regulator of GroEL
MANPGLAQDDTPVTPDTTAASVSDSATAPTPEPERTWHESFSSASQIAVRDKKQMLLVFETEWCQWCKAMNDTTWVDPQVLSFAKGIIFVRIDADLDSTTVQRFHVGRFPTAILTTDQALEVDRFVGYFPPGKFREELTRAMEGESTVWEYERILKERNDGHVMVRMAREYIERGEPGKSLELLLRAKSADFDGNLGVLDDAMFVEAMIERDDRNWYKSLTILKKLVKDHPKSEWREDSELYIPWLLAQAGDEEEAIRKYNEFLNTYGGSTETQWVKRQIAKLEAEEEAAKGEPLNPEGQ